MTTAPNAGSFHDLRGSTSYENKLDGLFVALSFTFGLELPLTGLWSSHLHHLSLVGLVAFVFSSFIPFNCVKFHNFSLTQVSVRLRRLSMSCALLNELSCILLRLCFTLPPSSKVPGWTA